MVVLRLVFLYGVAAVIAFGAAHRLVRRLRPAAAAFLALAPLLLTGEAVFTGGVYAPLEIAYQSHPLLARAEALGVGPPRSQILGDVVYQMIPWQKAVREAVGNGRLPLWNPFVLAGEPLLAVQQHGALHPTFWPGLLLPPPAAWTLMLTLRLFVALLCAYLFLRELGCREISALLGASGWAFSDFLVFFLGYPLNASISALPLLLLGLRRLVRQPGRGAVGVTLAALLLMTTGGHPETLLHGVAGAGVYFFFELAWAPAGARGRAVRLALLAGAFALGLSAVLLLPFREAALQTLERRARADFYARSVRSAPVGVALERSIKNVVPYAFGTWAHGGEKDGFVGAAGYAGALILSLALVGLTSRRRERWPFLALGAVGLAAWARLPIFSDVLARLPLFAVALNEYLVMLAPLALAVLAALGLDRLSEPGGRPRLIVAAAVTLAAIGLLFLHAQPNLARVPPVARTALWTAQVVPVFLLALLALFLRAGAVGKVLPMAALVLLLGQRRVEAGSFYSTLPSRAFYPPIPLFDPIPRGQPFRVAALSYTLVPNTAAMYGLEDVRGYEAMTLERLTETFPLWCVPQPVWFNRIDDPTKPFLSFLNVRYVIAPVGHSPPPGWNVLAEDGSLRLLENPAALPRAFVPRWTVRESEPDRERARLFAIRDFAEGGVVRGTPSPPERNGDARVEIDSYTAQRLELSIDASRKTLVATSVTGWLGWRLAIDGKEQPLLSYNRAFLAFEVPAGRHRAELVYWPRSLTMGLWLAGLSLVAALAYFCRPRRDVAAGIPRGF